NGPELVIEATKALRTAIRAGAQDGPLASVAIPTDMGISASVACADASISAVILVRNIAEIVDSVVSTVSIYVIDLVLWEGTVGKAPRRPVRINALAEDEAELVPLTVVCPERL